MNQEYWLIKMNFKRSVWLFTKEKFAREFINSWKKAGKKVGCKLIHVREIGAEEV